MKSGSVRIYYYHGILPQRTNPYLDRNFHTVAELRAQLRRLASCRILAMDELADALHAPGKIRRPAAMLTFDDGYANNMLAAEILARARVPWCLFVSTEAIGRRSTTWPMELSLLLLHGQARHVETLGRRWLLGSTQERSIACEVIRRVMKTLPKDLRERSLDELRSHFPSGETERLLRAFPSTRSLTWSEVRQLSRAGVEIGSHGVHHEIHHARQPAAVRRFELLRSGEVLAEKLGVPSRAFAFPNGDHARGASRLVKAAGYRYGFTTTHATATASSDPFALPRLEPETL